MNKSISTKICFALAFCALTFLSACADVEESPNNKIKVTTSFYPLYEIAEQVGGENIEITNLVPAGAEPHDYELTPKQIADLYKSQILLINGAGLEPWVQNLLPDLQKQPTLKIVDASKVAQNLIANDPHIWLGLDQYQQQVTAFEKTLSEVDPMHQDQYRQNAKNFMDKLTALDVEFQNGLKDCTFKDFVTNHAAFQYLARKYNLNMIAIAGFSPDAEPSSKMLVELTNVIKQKKIHYILTESLISPKIAETLAQETGAKTLVLNPLEGLADREIAQGQNYLSVMRENLKNLQIALECK